MWKARGKMSRLRKLNQKFGGNVSEKYSIVFSYYNNLEFNLYFTYTSWKYLKIKSHECSHYYSNYKENYTPL